MIISEKQELFLSVRDEVVSVPRTKLVLPATSTRAICYISHMRDPHGALLFSTDILASEKTERR